MTWKIAFSSILLGLGIGVALGYVIAPPHSETEESNYEMAKVKLTEKKKKEDLCDRIPDKILDASIIKYCEDDAKYVLMHIRQVHDAKNIIEWEEKEIIVVQKEIYQLLIHLKEKYNVSEVYSEGEVYGQGLENSVCRMATGVKKFGKSIDSGTELLFLMSQYDAATSKEEKERIRHEAQTKYDQFQKLKDPKYERDLTFLKCGAALVLEIEGKMITRIGEDFQTYRTAIEEPSKKDYVMRRREDSLLQIVASEGKPLNVMVFGGAHSFNDNISEWNSLHPDQKFSLITVTPASYPN